MRTIEEIFRSYEENPHELTSWDDPLLLEIEEALSTKPLTPALSMKPLAVCIPKVPWWKRIIVAAKATARRDWRTVGIYLFSPPVEMEDREEKVQRLCNHKKPHGSTALAGQFIDVLPWPSRELVLVCIHCGKDWHFPRDKGKLPAELFPHMDQIGYT